MKRSLTVFADFYVILFRTFLVSLESLENKVKNKYRRKQSEKPSVRKEIVIVV